MSRDSLGSRLDIHTTYQCGCGADILVKGQVPYFASKHALQCIAESLKEEFKPSSIQVQIINPAPFLTGFNETIAESVCRWQDDTRNFIKRADLQKFYDFLGNEDFQSDPKEMILMQWCRSCRWRLVPQRGAKGSSGVCEDKPEGSLGK